MAVADKDAPYLVVMIAAGLGWLVTFIADQYSTVPTLEIEKIITTRSNGDMEGIFKFTNVSHKSAITIHQLDFMGEAILVSTQAPCAQFINIAPYRVADVNPPFETSGQGNSCNLPITLREVGLLPGAGFGVQLNWKAGGNIIPFVVEKNAQMSDSQDNNNANSFRITWSNSLEAWISRNLNITLITGGLVGLIIASYLISRRTT